MSLAALLGGEEGEVENRLASCLATIYLSRNIFGEGTSCLVQLRRPNQMPRFDGCSKTPVFYLKVVLNLKELTPKFGGGLMRA